jgi:Condensation domain
MPLLEIKTRLTEHRFCVLYEHKPEYRANNMVALFQLTCAVVPDLFERALHCVIRAHDLLRARFELRGDRYVAIVQDDIKCPLEVLQLAKAGLDELQTHLRAVAQKAVFDEISDPRIKVVLVVSPEGGGGMVIAIDHMISDAYSFNLICSDLIKVYESLLRGELTSLSRPTKSAMELSRAEDEYMRSAQAKAALAWWSNRLRCAPPAARLSEPGGIPSWIYARIESHQVTRINMIARHSKASPAQVALARYVQALSRHVAGGVVVVRGIYSLRVGFGLVSCLIDHMVHVVPVRKDETLTSICRKVVLTTMESFQHYVPYWHLTNVLQPDLYLSNCGLSENEFNFVPSSGGYHDEAWQRHIKALHPDLIRAWVTFQRGLVILEKPDHWQVAFGYDPKFVSVDEGKELLADLTDW